MKFRFLLIGLISTSSYANVLYKDTLTFASSSKVARDVSNCEVIYDKLYGTSNLSSKFKTYALFEMSMEGMKKDLKSNQMAEYNFGYQFQKTYWNGWYSAITTQSSEGARKVMTMIYKKSNCEEYLK
ncbi:MAG: hypothetical protein COA84_11685 [Robiginitomaculum sp.]|nr:MAG: hypothetical protein COA84_11685 [Robiginitomaculum sp.]